VSLFRRTPDERRQRALRSAAPGPLRDYLGVPFPAPSVPLDELPLLAVDIETTGLDPRVDRVLSIGWVPVDGGSVVLGGAGRVVVRDEVGGAGGAGVGSSATIHGLTDDALAGGEVMADAVARLLGALTGSGAAGTLRADRDRVPVGCVRAALGCAAAVRRRRHPGPRAPGRHGPRAARPRAGGAAVVVGARTARAARVPAHEALVDALACAELYLAQRAELQAARPETTLTLRQVMA
jgi:DNA polymerase-3 subunit epsilon